MIYPGPGGSARYSKRFSNTIRIDNSDPRSRVTIPIPGAKNLFPDETNTAGPIFFVVAKTSTG